MSRRISPLCIGRNALYSGYMKKSERFEKLFVEAMVRRVEAAGMSHSEFGRRVFGEGSGSRAWRATREKDRKRGLGIGEAYMMAEALGMEFPALVWEVMQEVKDRLN